MSNRVPAKKDYRVLLICLAKLSYRTTLVKHQLTFISMFFEKELKTLTSAL